MVVKYREYDTVWSSIEDGLGAGSEQMDGVFIPMSAPQREILRKALLADMAEHRQGEEDGNEYSGDEGMLSEVYWTERMEATHWFVQVTVPELDEDGNPDMSMWGPDYGECTWWDFGVLICKQVDGEWHAWSEDPSDIGNVWFQSPYTKTQAYAVRDYCVQYIEEHNGLYNEEDTTDRSYDYIERGFSDAVNAAGVHSDWR